MNSRMQLQTAYELAFFPPALNKFWRLLKNNRDNITEEQIKLLDMALLLHQALPSDGYASQRALKRVAIYQADSRAFGMVKFLEGIRCNLNLKPLTERTIPGWMIRDIGLPAFCRRQASQKPQSAG